MNDQKLLNKGLALLPDLYESYVEAERTVAIAKDGQGAVCVGPAESCRTRLLKKGDSVVLDFGDHQVGYLSLKFGTEGSHADAPVLLRLHFLQKPFLPVSAHLRLPHSCLPLLNRPLQSQLKRPHRKPLPAQSLSQLLSPSLQPFRQHLHR